jgi:hypothetical protein
LLILMIIISMGWHYIYKLWPPMGVLFIPQVIHEHGEPWWNDINKGKLLIHWPELSGNPTSSHLVAKHEELAKEMKLALPSIFVHTSESYLTCHKILRHGANGFTSPPKEGMLQTFYHP